MKTKKRKLLRAITAILCVFLVIYPNFQEPLKTLAEEKTTYIAEVRLFEGKRYKSADENFEYAKAIANSQGFTLIRNDLNEGSMDDHPQDVYLGYKTTTDPSEAITDIRTLAMDRDYYLYNYKDFLDYMRNANEGTGTAMYTASQAFITNYKAGSPKAIDAYTGLNLFYVDEANMKLGDYILKGKADKDLFLEIAMRASTGIVNAVLNYLNSGVAPFDPNKEATNWAVALQHSELKEKVKSSMTEAERSAIKKKYDDDAREIFIQIQNFTTQFETAALRRGYIYTGVIDYTAEDKEGNPIESYEEAVEAMDEMDEEDGDAMYLSAYEILNQFDYDETTKLGDWLLEVGRQNAEYDLMELYPLVDAMGEAQTGLIRTIGFIPAVSNLSQNTSSPKLQEVLPKIQGAIEDYNGGEYLSVWTNADDSIEDSYIAYTTDAIRKSDGNNSIGKKSKFDVIDEKVNNVMKWVEIGMGIGIVGSYVLKLAFTGLAKGLAYFSGSAACVSLSSAFSALASVMTIAGSALMWAGIIVLAFTIGWAIGKFLGKGIKKALPEKWHSKVPSYVFDAVDTSEGTITVKYMTVRNWENALGDVNSYDHQKWQILCYSKDPAAGSPLVLDKDGNFAKVVKGNGTVQNGYDCINFFGERSPGNMNAYTDKDKVNGIYVSYRTVRSIASEGPSSEEKEPSETTPSGVNYLADILVSTAKTAEAAKAKITAKQGKYYILDTNLSPGTGNYTYLGYAMTTDPERAVTDLRIAPYSGTDQVMYGDISYGYAGFLGVAKEDGDNSIASGDALLKTSDKRAGSPILADGLHVIYKHSEAEDGWEPVTLFNGLPYNFASWYIAAVDDNTTSYISAYKTDKSHNWSRTNVYLYYEPTEKYTSGTKYLAGFFCIQGTNITRTIHAFWSQTACNISELKQQILTYPKAIIDDTDMSLSVQTSMWHGHSRPYQYLGYTWTYNPKRAITDVTLFQGDTYQNTLPYSFSRPSNGVSIGYIAASTICQQNASRGDTVMNAHRLISPSNAIINDHALMVLAYDYDRSLMDGYTKTLANGFEFTYERSNFLPLGLYMSGPVEGKSPLTLADVVVSNTKVDNVEDGGLIACYFGQDGTGTQYTLDGSAASTTGAFHSIYEAKNPYALEAYNICYPTWYSSGGDQKKGSQLYIYIKGALPAKAKYISSVTVGSYSRQQYTSDMLNKKASVEEDEINMIDSSVNLNAMISAVSTCEHEVICVNMAASSGKAWYQRADKHGKAETTAPENVPAAYLGITRTDKATKAITAILLYESDNSTVAAKMKIEGAEYYCDSPSTPIVINGRRYFLYYTRNRGVLSGARVMELEINDEVFISGMATALSVKKGSTVTTGSVQYPNYIHLKFDKEEGVYYNELFLGKGKERDIALTDLASQECFQFIDLDMNCSTGGSYVYMGYSSASIDMENSSKTKIRMAWSEAIWDIIITKNQPYMEEGFVCEKNGIYYVPVSDVDLNDGAEGCPDELYMYYCCPVISEDYNDAHGVETVMPDEVFSAPISKMAFARYDRVPYNSSLEGTDETGNDIVPWEYVMLADHSAPANFNSGAFQLNSDGYVENNRVTMFVQRYDGSFKPSAQITGGYTDKNASFGTANVG